MKQKELDKITKPLREKGATHLLLAKTKGGIVLSSIATGDDIYEFLQVLVDTNEQVLDIMQAVIDSRTRVPERRKDDILLN
jgi:hypothetical protein